MKTLSILSNKGGVGKTSIAVNIAVYLAKQGNNVCLLDNDFSGPSLQTFFEPKSTPLNKFLFEDSKLGECLQDISKDYNFSGKLFVGFLDPSPEAVQSAIRINKNESFAMLKNLMKLRKTIQKDPYNCEYLIMDSSPGTGYTTVNVMLSTKVSLFIVKFSNADVSGTASMIAGLYKNIKNKCLVLANQIPEHSIEDKNKRDELECLITNLFQEKIGEQIVEFIGWIPTDFNLQTIEFEEAVKSLRGESYARKIFALEDSDDVISTGITKIIPKIFTED